MTLSEKLNLYIQLTRFNKPIGTLLLLWPTLWAVWIAGEGSPSPLVFVVFSLGVILMRSAGCVINDYADRKVDKHVERTQHRPITSGKVSSREALILFAVLTLIAFALVLTMNSLTVRLSFAAVFLATLYPFMKRYTHLPQIVLGAAFGWAIPMSFAAETGSVPAASWLLFFATLSWTVAYDTMYAMVDRDDDLKIGIKSTAILFGKQDRLIIGVFQLITLALLIAAGRAFELGLVYYSGLVVATGLGLYHQWLIREREKASCFKAFLHNNWLGAVVFLGIAGDYFLMAK